ncbi:E3 ubiquitin-protein ligase MARCHF2 isoform X2 [Natator depressus]|uniref:E3 ubiquitin-protein ligase MARCHF2 isoform X2 n=1 Tax=Natator depressus TaxID=27790 RepID=UPI003EBB2351
MTTGDCCHLPGSLCDCPGSAALSKSVEDSDIGRPQYVTQVTAKDGRLLSTVIKALGAQSDGPICRICHEGGNGEGLLSPCDCTGTLGTVHKSCLEKWLSSSNTSYCELCHTEFVVERRPRPLTEGVQPPLPQPCCLTPSMEMKATQKQILRMRKIAHSKQAEKPVFLTARNCFSPWTWSQYPPNPPKAAFRTRQAEKGSLLHVFQGSQDLLLPRG